MGFRRRIARAPRCSLKLYRQAHDRGLKSFAEYLQTCGVPLVYRKPRPKRTKTS